MTGPVQVHRHMVTQQFRGGVISVQDAATTGLIQRRVRLMSAGMHCSGETRGAGDDEMYAVIAVYPPDRGDQSHVTVKVPDGDGEETTDMNDGTTSTEGMREIWSGPPQDLIISVTLFEHDNSVPSAMKTLVDGESLAGSPQPEPPS